MKIRESLNNVLQKMRYGPPGQKYEIWVDALCIKQEYLNERQEQVALMGKIYSQATTVFSWLGEEADDSPLAFRVIELFQNCKAGDSPSKITSIQNALQSLSSPVYDRHWAAFGKLMKREYWTRVWIMQEVMLSDRVALACGSDVCSWSAVSFILSAMDYRKAVSYSPGALKVLGDPHILPRSFATLYELRRKGGNVSFSTWLYLGRQRSSGEPLDHIYSILSLVEHGGLKADYTKTCDQLYRETTKHVIGLENSLDILSSCGNPLHLDPELAISYENILASRAFLSSNYDAEVSRIQSQSNLDKTAVDTVKAHPPSWTPAFHYRNRASDRHSLVINLRSTCYYRASGNSVPDVRFVGPNEEIMLAYGILVDEIVAVHPENKTSQIGFASEWRFWEENLPSRYGGDSGRRGAFKCTAALGRDCNGRKQTFSAVNPINDDLFGLPPLSDGSTGQTYISTEDWFDALMCGQVEWQFFVTKEGFIGRGPVGIKSQDVIVVLLGGKVPFVVRRALLGVGWLLVGEVYVQGVMEGEVMDDLAEGIRTLQEFTFL